MGNGEPLRSPTDWAGCLAGFGSAMDERRTRREFLKLAGLAGAGALLAPEALRRAAIAAQETTRPADIPTRAFGKLGRRVPILGCGCSLLDTDDETAIAMLDRAIDLGVTYIDIAPSYMGTRSERIVGRVMAKRRDEVWLTTKTLQRAKEGAAREIDESLARLCTDHADALFLHAVNTDRDVDRVLHRNGAVEALAAAKEAGKTRAIGVSSHRGADVAVRLLGEHPFDLVLIPLGPGDRFYLDFVDKVIPKAREVGATVVGMLCCRSVSPRVPGGSADAERALRYALALDVTTSIVCMQSIAEVEEICRTAAAFAAPSDSERTRLLDEIRRSAAPEPPWWKR
jgi:aryl-alcohol dehydrogenase-like predicted oxidoreductase